MGNPFEALENRRQRIQQVAENSARLASSYATFTSTGWGEFRQTTVTRFNLTFITKPIIAYSYEIDGDALVDTRFPRSHGFVYKWQQDSRDYYTGCWVAFVVDTRNPYITTAELDPNYDLVHHFTFTGIALKDLPAYLLDN